MSYTSYSYTKGGYFTGMPIGSLVGFNSTTIPSGWIKCDGTTVSNTTGLYNNLINLGIGTGTVNSGNYTPPALSDCIMMGVGSGVNTALGKVDGNNTASLYETNIPDHTHASGTINASSHTHTYSDYYVQINEEAGWAHGHIPGTTAGDTAVGLGSFNQSHETFLVTTAATDMTHVHTVNFAYSDPSIWSLTLDVTNPSIAVFFILKYK